MSQPDLTVESALPLRRCCPSVLEAGTTSSAGSPMTRGVRGAAGRVPVSTHAPPQRAERDAVARGHCPRPVALEVRACRITPCGVACGSLQVPNGVSDERVYAFYNAVCGCACSALWPFTSEEWPLQSPPKFDANYERIAHADAVFPCASVARSFVRSFVRSFDRRASPSYVVCHVPCCGVL